MCITCRRNIWTYVGQTRISVRTPPKERVKSSLLAPITHTLVYALDTSSNGISYGPTDITIEHTVHFRLQKSHRINILVNLRIYLRTNAGELNDARWWGEWVPICHRCADTTSTGLPYNGRATFASYLPALLKLCVARKLTIHGQIHLLNPK